MLLACVSCQHKHTLTPEDTSVSRTKTYQQMIDMLIKRDAENKKYIRTVFNEIDVAVRNDDYDAFRFFLNEYLETPSEIVPYFLRNEPGYVQPVTQLEMYFRVRLYLPATVPTFKPIPEHAE